MLGISDRSRPVHVLIAPDSFGGTMTAREVAAAFADGWSDARPSDTVTQVPLSDGGEGLVDVLAALLADARVETIEVAGTDTRPVTAPVLWLDARTAVLESATICGLPPDVEGPRRPMEATSYGVGQALAHVASAGARRIILGLGGTGVVDGGSGALNALGFRLRVADGSGLRVGARDLVRCVAIEPGWSAWPDDVRLELLADTDAVLADAVHRFGPQKGVTEAQVPTLIEAFTAWAGVVGRSFPASTGPDAPHTGAAGGLGFALQAVLNGVFVPGSAWVAEQAGLDAAVAAADLVVTGEGRLDATTSSGKVVDRVLAVAREEGRAVAAVVGSAVPGSAAALGLPEDRIVTAPARGPGPAADAAVREAARILALRVTSVHSRD